VLAAALLLKLVSTAFAGTVTLLDRMNAPEYRN